MNLIVGGSLAAALLLAVASATPVRIRLWTTDEDLPVPNFRAALVVALLLTLSIGNTSGYLLVATVFALMIAGVELNAAMDLADERPRGGRHRC